MARTGGYSIARPVQSRDSTTPTFERTCFNIIDTPSVWHHRFWFIGTDIGLFVIAVWVIIQGSANCQGQRLVVVGLALKSTVLRLHQCVPGVLMSDKIRLPSGRLWCLMTWDRSSRADCRKEARA